MWVHKCTMHRMQVGTKGSHSIPCDSLYGCCVFHMVLDAWLWATGKLLQQGTNCGHLSQLVKHLEHSAPLYQIHTQLVPRTLRPSASADNAVVPFHARLAIQVKLLQFVRPQDFDNFRHFVRWRDTTANILLQILQRAAQQPASEDDRYPYSLLLQAP